MRSLVSVFDITCRSSTNASYITGTFCGWGNQEGREGGREKKKRGILLHMVHLLHERILAFFLFSPLIFKMCFEPYHMLYPNFIVLHVNAQ